MKKLTKDSFSALRSSTIVLNEDQQRAIKGGGYFDDYGIGYYDSSGSYHWTRTSEGSSAFYADLWDSSSSSSSGNSNSGLFVYNSTSGYGTSVNPLSVEDYNTLAKVGRWEGGYVAGLGYVNIYASSVDYGNSIYVAGSWYRYGDQNNPVSEADFNELVDQGKWNGGYVQGFDSYVLPTATVIVSSGNSNSFDIYDAVSYIQNNALESSAGACARFVRQAIEAGGLSTNGRPLAACDYETYLPTIGFSVINSSNYTPQAGDIVVHEAQPGHSYGHIAMYTGQQWISDFIQIDMFGGSAYRENPDYTILRWNP